MKNLIKKNHLMITALAIMIAIAGYLQFAGTDLEEEYLTADTDTVTGAIMENLTSDDLSGGSLSDMNLEEFDSLEDGLLDLSAEDLLSGVSDIESLDEDTSIVAENYLDSDMQTAQVQPEEGEIPGEAVFTATNGVEVLSEAKLLKEQTRARNKETLMELINSEGLTDVQKQEAVDSMVRMTEISEKESAAEILLEAKGFRDVVVSVNGNKVDVVVNAAELTEAQRAQIEDIVKRKTEVGAENIVISTVVNLE
ncbi:MAG: SpoIIIAH-like family protein [Clostridium sp.]|nr:SpoIIIAH-like family protein [Clostridium sp.]